MKVKATNCDVYFQLDEEDASLLNGNSWGVFRGYVRRSRKGSDGGREKRRNIFLHAEIMQPPPGYVVDHINGDRLDNRRANLRVCTHDQNIMNSVKGLGWFSKFKGVSKGEKEKWVAFCGPRSGNRYIGVFKTEEDAARAYDKRAIELYGPYARVNFPGGDE